MVGSRSMSVVSNKKVPLNDGKINIAKKGGGKIKLIRIGGTKNMKLREMGQIKLAEVGQF